MKILIIEDDPKVVEKFISKLKDSDIMVYPNQLNQDQEFDEFKFINRNISKKDFSSIVENFKDIDLFIIDFTIKEKKDVELPELDFYKFLEEVNYRNGNYDTIFLIGHSKSTEQFILAPYSIESNKIFSKETRVKGDFTDSVMVYINRKFNQNLEFDQESVKIQNMTMKYKVYLERLITIVFTILMVLSIFYALVNITSDLVGLMKNNLEDTYESLNNTSTVSREHFELLKKKENIEKIKFVEHIFIYLLPIFIIMGFYSYFKHTTSVLLTGARATIDDSKALKTLNASKGILLTSILAFALIKLIEILSIEEKIKLEIVLSLGGIVIVLMVFTLIHNKQSGK